MSRTTDTTATSAGLAGLAGDVRGPVDGAPVVQLHGLTSSRARDVTLGLDLTAGQDGLRVLRYDARGHGRSPGPAHPEAYRWLALARDLEQVADDFSPGVPVHAVGQSMGAATILTSAAGHGCTYASMTLCIPPTAWELRGDRAGVYERSAQFVEEHGLAAYAESTRAEPAPPARGTEVPFTLPDVPESLLPTVFRGAAGNDLPSRARVAVLGERRIPTLILAWAGDAAHPVAVAGELHALLPGSRLVTARTPEDVARWPEVIGDFIRGRER
ncbi:alpha/beta fold hydrolase [Corynebacteriaceae bacterium 7-707]